MIQKLTSSSSSSLSSLICHSNNLIRALHFSTSVSSPPDFLPSYLENRYGVPHQKAVDASKLFLRCGVLSPAQPDSVIAFFKSNGFDDSHLRKLVQWNPSFLTLDVERALTPRFRALHELGFTGIDLTDLVSRNPHVIMSRLDSNVMPKIEFWRRLLGSHRLLMKCLTSTPWQILSCSLSRIQTNISFLQDLGISDREISTIVSKNPLIIIQKLELLSKLILRAENLGVPRGSHNFHMVIFTLSKAGEDNVQQKVELFKGFGWSNDNFSQAFRRTPFLVTCSLKVLEEKMEFLVKEAGCNTSYIALNPVLLTLSLEKRLVPRLHVLKALKEKGLSGGNHKLATTMTLTNKKFFERYVDLYKDVVPELSQLFSGSFWNLLIRL